MVDLPFHVMTKPLGPICNLDCTYCYYLEKEKYYPGESRWKMGDDVLEAYIRQYIQEQNAPEIHFMWQGGEPTLLGIDFFRRALDIQKRYASGKRIHNALQANGTLLDDAWGEFLAGESFLVGISIDGPRPFHDRYRFDKKGQSTFDAVVRGIDVLKRFKVEFSTLTVVGRENSRYPIEVYRFLRQISSGYMQFLPLVERANTTQLTIGGHDLAGTIGKSLTHTHFHKGKA